MAPRETPIQPIPADPILADRTSADSVPAEATLVRDEPLPPPVTSTSATEPDGTQPALVGPVRRIVYLAAAALLFVVAMLGVLLPGLPTTPFLLLTSYLLVRSSPALNERMMRSRLFGPILRDWREHRGVRPHVKARALGLIVLVVAATLWLGKPPWPAAAGMLALVAVGLWVVWRLPEIDALPGDETE